MVNIIEFRRVISGTFVHDGLLKIESKLNQ